MEPLEEHKLADAECDDMIEWVKCENGKGAIDRAGQYLADWWIGDVAPEDYDKWSQAIDVVENWRACHALPLNVVQKALRDRAQKIEPKVIVAQRLKRFPSIMNKLSRESSMKLSQMQDLGGCRAILSSVKNVIALYDAYRPSLSLLLPEETSRKPYDYISHPKEDGYRGIHVVARYHPRIANRAPWNGL